MKRMPARYGFVDAVTSDLCFAAPADTLEGV
jgi:hypothetical protein